jgi:hypothetical protein
MVLQCQSKAVRETPSKVVKTEILYKVFVGKRYQVAVRDERIVQPDAQRHLLLRCMVGRMIETISGDVFKIFFALSGCLPRQSLQVYNLSF